MEVHGFADSEQYVRSALPDDVSASWPVQHVDVCSIGLDASRGVHAPPGCVFLAGCLSVRPSYLYTSPLKGGGFIQVPDCIQASS